jgi:hypothetical protein
MANVSNWKRIGKDSGKSFLMIYRFREFKQQKARIIE